MGGGMKRVELYGQVRRAVYVEGVSRREAARRLAYEPRALSAIATRTEAKTDAIVDVLPFPPGAPSFVREHHQLGLHLHVDRSNRHACFLPAPRKVTFRIEQSPPLPLSDVP